MLMLQPQIFSKQMFANEVIINSVTRFAKI